MQNFYLFLVLTIFIPITGMTQDCLSYFHYSKDEISQSVLCPEAMKADIEQLHEHILTTHPNPSLYCGVEAFVNGYKQAIASCSSEKTMIEFIQIVTTYLAVMKDSHTNLNPRDYLYLGPKDRAVLPFFVVRIDGKFYLESIYKNDSSSRFVSYGQFIYREQKIKFYRGECTASTGRNRRTNDWRHLQFTSPRQFVGRCVI